jgi:metal-responsive CopG/Arc/MetJ family transcriptional regulator
MKTAIKIDKSLCRRVEQAAAKAGYSSREEFIEHAIEKELTHYEEGERKDEVIRKLKGLGYIE